MIVFDYGGVLGNDPGESIYRDISNIIGLSPQEVKNVYKKYNCL